MKKMFLLDVPHRHVVFTIPKMLRIFFKFKHRLLGDLCRSALQALTRYIEVIDIAAGPAIEYRHGWSGGFIAESGNSRAAEKGNSYFLKRV